MCSLQTCQYALWQKCLRLDLLYCQDILLYCSEGTDLVFFWLIGCTWLTIQDSRHFSLSLQRCWMVAVEAFQIFVSVCARKFGWKSASRSRPTMVSLTEWLETFLLESKKKIEATWSTRLILSAILFTNGDEKCGQKKVELIGRYVFNCSRLFQWLSKYFPCV